MFNNIYTRGKTRFLPPLGYLEADTGTHKTTATYSSVIERSRFNIQIVVCEKKTLLDEWEEGLKKVLSDADLPASKIKKIHCDCIDKNQTVNSTVSEWLNKYTNNKNSCEGIAGASGILLITQATLDNLTDLTRNIKAQCDIWFDELLSVDQEHRVQVKNNPAELKDFIQLSKDPTLYCKTKVPVIVNGQVELNSNGEVKRKTIDDAVHTTEAISKGALQDELSKKGQNYSQPIKNLLNAVLSENKTVYIKRSQWDLMAYKLSKNDDGDQGSTFFLSLLGIKLLSGWKSLTVISADFTKSKFYHWMTKQHRLAFIPHRQTKRTLLNSGYHDENLLKRTTFVTLMTKGEERRNSKSFLDDYGKEIDARLYEELKSLNKPFLLCTNKDRKDGRALTKLKGCTIITSKDHGTNAFQDNDVVVFDAALNHKPDHKTMLELLGFSDEVVYEDMTLNVQYQIASRSSLRNKGSNAPVTIYCMNTESALALAKRYAANNVGQVMKIRHIEETEYTCISLEPSCESGMASPMVATRPYSSNENTSYCEKDGHHINHLSVPVFRKASNHGTYSNHINSHAEFPATPITEGVAIGSAKSGANMAFTLYNKKNSLQGEVISGSPMKLVKQLKAFHVQKVHDRSKRPHLSPCIVKPVEHGQATRNKRSTHHGYANFLYADTLVLDFDGHGETNHKDAITPDQFIGYFSQKRQNKAEGVIKHCFIICSTHNTSKVNPYKFRVFMPLKNPATTIEEYKACYRYIDETLSLHGHGYAPYNGLDVNSQKPTQFFNVPGTNIEHEKYAFFTVKNLKDSRYVKRHGLNPVELLEQYPPASIVTYKGTIDKLKAKAHFNLQSVIRDYHGLVDGRRLGLKQLGKKCATTGAMGFREVEQILWSVVNCEDDEMKKRVNDTMVQLVSEVQWWGMAA